MPSKTISCIVGLALLCTASGLAEPHTPKPGSEERKAICDGLRDYILRKVATKKLPQPIVFKVDYLRVDDGYAWFEGIPLFKDGSYTSDYLPDVGYMMVLQKADLGWKVRHDLSRTDVPDEAEATQLRKTLASIPTSILPDFWRKQLKR
jgi:hypothetical protein